MNAFQRILLLGIVASNSTMSSLEATELLWGDTHVHSSLSIDPEGEPDETNGGARVRDE